MGQKLYHRRLLAGWPGRFSGAVLQKVGRMSRRSARTVARVSYGKPPTMAARAEAVAQAYMADMQTYIDQDKKAQLGYQAAIDDKEPTLKSNAFYVAVSAAIREKKRAAGMETKRPRKEPVPDDRLSLPFSPSPRELRRKRSPASSNNPAPEAAESKRPRELTVKDLLPVEAQRLRIAYYYLDDLGAPPEDEWKQYQGTIYDIYTGVSGLGQNNYNMIVATLKELHRCAKAGVEYTGKTKSRAFRASAVLKLGSTDARIVADAMERHMGLRKTHFLLCISRRKRKLPWVGLSAVYSLHLALKPVVTPIEDCKQGKTDRGAFWSVARHMFTTQYCIRRGFDVQLPCLLVRELHAVDFAAELVYEEEPVDSWAQMLDPGFVHEVEYEHPKKKDGDGLPLKCRRKTKIVTAPRPMEGPDFDYTPASTFSGCPAGYAFMTGYYGLGYYRGAMPPTCEGR